MRAGERLRAWPTAGRVASKGIAKHVALRLKLQGARGVLAYPTHAILWRMWLNFLSVSVFAERVSEYAAVAAYRKRWAAPFHLTADAVIQAGAATSGMVCGRCRAAL